jgi:hypothetical protein
MVSREIFLDGMIMGFAAWLRENGRGGAELADLDLMLAISSAFDLAMASCFAARWPAPLARPRSCSRSGPPPQGGWPSGPAPVSSPTSHAGQRIRSVPDAPVRP